MTVDTTANDPRTPQRRVLVTGAASGIGEATVDLCLAAGAVVAGFDVTPHEANNDRRRDWVCDVSDEDAVATCVAEATEWLGGLDAVLHVAGIVGDNTSGADELAKQDWDQVIGVNLTGAWLIAKHTLGLLESTGGTLALTGSGAGVHNAHTSVAYAASKGGLNGLAITLEETWRRRGVNVVAVLPGSVDTPLVRRYGTHDRRENRKSEHLMLEAVEVGSILAFLATPGASGVRGPIRTW